MLKLLEELKKVPVRRKLLIVLVFRSLQGLTADVTDTNVNVHNRPAEGGSELVVFSHFHVEPEDTGPVQNRPKNPPDQVSHSAGSGESRKWTFMKSQPS